MLSPSPSSSFSSASTDHAPSCDETFLSTHTTPNYFASAKVWRRYHDVRPAYPDVLFDLIFQYHKSKLGTRFDLAADFGSGPGTIVPDLLRAFKRVEASDINQWQVDTGKRVLKEVYGSRRVGFHQGAAGDCTWIQDGTADLFIAAEAAQWFDMDKWITEAARKLRRGGTLAIIYYGCNATILDSPEAATACNTLFSILFETTWAQTGFPKGALLSHVTKFDCVGFPKGMFDKSKEERHKWNLPRDVGGPYNLGENPPSSRALFSNLPDLSKGSKHFVYEPQDGQECFLRREGWTSEDLLEYIESLGMPMENLFLHPKFEQTIDELHRVVGGPEGRFTAGWWLTLVLATRK